MIYIEMTRDETHGGGTWAFPNCVWAPTEKRGGGAWPFWTKVRDVRAGDAIIHLRGVSPHANFIGYSIASGSGFETNRRPPDPKEWSYAKKFYRADLSDFVKFHQPINLRDLFSSRRRELEKYFEKNKSREAVKLNVFYVMQSGRLQCQNGAYLSDVDDELLTALFGHTDFAATSSGREQIISVSTSSQFVSMKARIGHDKFSAEIKKLYGYKCCFPGCPVSDQRFLVASHIARWSDNEKLRGHLGNGLCLCLVHDKAFEAGMFTLDEKFRVCVNPKEPRTHSAILNDLVFHDGEQITLSSVVPLVDALFEHWGRVDIEP